ncbi:hypothetical protein JCGZ_05470 [Jatropha curcas]|uniref:Myb-like domain-containing protein n=1 Tax=Jatropha curcas TaxID=180498 RepID=A0A067L9S7_JATCU|nr:RNA polymerase I termination factor isoform X1 [Jatropha curcas]XP_037495098.1 RNA polymerase I termination factor isoform X2 [Jatropha curcas]KDP44003.1 hypothetical protein JCGZ_05470 [Jatropha curcas]
MGTKSVGKKGHEKEKKNNAEEGFCNEDKKNKVKDFGVNDNDFEPSDTEIETVNIEGGLNNQEIENKKRQHKDRKSGQGSANVESQVMEKMDDRHRISNSENVSEMINGKEVDQRKTKIKKQKKHKDVVHGHVIKSATDRKEVENGRDHVYVEDPRKERKKKKGQHNVNLDSRSTKITAETVNDESNRIIEDVSSIDLAENQVGDGKVGAHARKAADGKDKKKRKREDIGSVGLINEDVGSKSKCLDENILKKVNHSGKERKKKKKHDGMEGKDGDREQKMGGGVEDTNSSQKSTPNTAKRVSFSENVEVFPSSDGPSDEETQKDKLVQGKRFSPEEDEMVKVAVLNYIDSHGLGEEGLNMVLHCKKYPEVKNCWKEIGAALPWRPHSSVYYRAHILFQRDKKRKWTPEEVEFVQKFHEKYGSDWKTMAEILGKHRFHVKDTWRRIKLKNRKEGRWSQEEYQNLFDLVNKDLRLKALEEVKKSKHGMLRDNISWTAISDQLGTRTTPTCCLKWYNQLTSPMVAQGEWLDVDDYNLVIALYDLDACCMEDVDWDSLLEHRSGDLCRKRWSQMVKHIGEHGNKSFADQVEVLMQRYCPDVLEAREAHNSKPTVT